MIKQHHNTAGPAMRALRRLLWLSLAPGFNPLEVWGALAAPLFPDPAAQVSLHL